MVNITVSLPDTVAQQYYTAAEKLSNHLAAIGQAPDAPTLMRFMLASFDAEDITQSFDLALRNMVGAPIPDEPEVWAFPSRFDNAP